MIDLKKIHFHYCFSYNLFFITQNKFVKSCFKALIDNNIFLSILISAIFYLIFFTFIFLFNYYINPDFNFNTNFYSNYNQIFKKNL